MTITDDGAAAAHPRTLGPYDDGVWYDAEVWCADLGINRSSLHNRRAAGLPGPVATLIHGRLGFMGADLNAFLRSQREPERETG